MVQMSIEQRQQFDTEIRSTIGHYRADVGWYVMHARNPSAGHVADMLESRSAAAVRKMTGYRPEFRTTQVWKPILERECESFIARLVAIRDQ